jgi:hypothetical protein
MMFAGHVGAALAIGRGERRINPGIFVFASLLLDVLLWIFVLVGWEAVTIPPNFAFTHQPEFVFPHSHGLMASIVWSLLAAAAASIGSRRRLVPKHRAATLVALAACSHWLLDALVHVPELPIAGASSMKVGLGLWQAMPVALALESVLLLTGLCLFVRGSSLLRIRKLWLIALAVLILALTLAGMTIAPPPPSPTAMAWSSLSAIAMVCGLIGWLGRLPK